MVLHATAGSRSGTLACFASPASGVSSHYVVAKDGDVWQMVEEDKLAHHAGGIPFDAAAAFPRYARQHDLGNPETKEFDFEYRGVNYRGLGFSKAIIHCTVGDWGNIKELAW